MKLINDAVRKMFVGQYENVAEKLLSICDELGIFHGPPGLAEECCARSIRAGKFSEALICLMYAAEKEGVPLAEDLISYINNMWENR